MGSRSLKFASRWPCRISPPFPLSAREENRILKKRVEDLTESLKVLMVENESLKVEVEIYRSEASAQTGPKETGAVPPGQGGIQTDVVGEAGDDFVTGGDGVRKKSE